jgi:hypothetical protein
MSHFDRLGVGDALRIVIVGFSCLWLAACATPAAVKQAVKNQSDVYVLLDRSIQDLGTAVRGLQRDLAAIDEESRARTCAGLVIMGEPLQSDCKNAMFAGSVFKSPSLDEYTKTIGQIDAAIRPPTSDQITPLRQRIKNRYDTFSDEQNALRNQVKALGIINATIGAYYEIDLSPGPEATKALLESIKPLAQ